MPDITVNQQVEVRRPMRNGTLVRIGSVVRINENGTADVHFPAETANANVPLKDLMPTSVRFHGVARRTLNPFAAQVQHGLPRR